RLLSRSARTLHSFGTDFDLFFSEKSLHDSGAVDAAVQRLKDSGALYHADGAWWLRSTEYGDDKDRVVIKSDGRPAYIAGDIAYYADKRARGFDKLRSEEHTSELQSRENLVCRLLLEKKNTQPQLAR